jgi:hypothetical protein
VSRVVGRRGSCRSGRRVASLTARSLLPATTGALLARRLVLVLLASAWVAACGPKAAPAGSAGETRAALPDSTFGALVARISEAGGYFDTDNLISNERGYLKVMGALTRLGVRGGAYVGVGPDQSFSYIARIRPEIAFIVDIRRDNLLQHLLLRALIERAPTRVGFLAGLFGRAPPPDPEAWRSRPVEDVVAYIDAAPVDSAVVARVRADVARAVTSFGVPLSDDDLATIRRFHQAFVDAGPGLRFSSFGRPPRPYYPTYRQLLLETDLEGDPASYLADAESYATVRRLELAGRIVPVVGDLAGAHAVREIGDVLREMGIDLSAFYVSNVEFYLWGEGKLDAWLRNVASLPAQDGAVVIRSYFPSYGRNHPSAVPGYYATQTLQPVSTLTAGGFADYWDLVTRDALPLR